MGGARKQVTGRYKGNNNNRGFSGNRGNGNEANLVNELSGQVEKLSTVIGKLISNQEGNIAVVKPVQGGGVKRSFQPTVGSGVHCRYCNNNNHSSANCKFNKNKNTRKSYYENNANMAMAQIENCNNDFCGMADEGCDRNRMKRDELDRSEAEMILEEFNTYNNLLKDNDFRTNSRDDLLDMVNDMAASYPEICRIVEECSMVEIDVEAKRDNMFNIHV